MTTPLHDTKEDAFVGPKAIVAAALRFDWFPEQTGIIRELIQLIASYAYTRLTSFGRGADGYVDGPHDTAAFHGPTGLCLSLDGEVLLCADQDNGRIRLIDLCDGAVTTYAGAAWTEHARTGPRFKVAVPSPYSVCADPIHPNCYYFGSTIIRYCDGEAVSLIAGGESIGYKDGVGGDALMTSVYGLICTSDGQALYFSDGSNYRLRCVDLKTRTVKTICGDGRYAIRDGVGTAASFGPMHQICFDHSHTTKPESVIFIATSNGVRRFDIATCALTTLGPSFAVYGIACTKAGVLIVSDFTYAKLSAVHIATGAVEGIDTTSAGKLIWPLGLALNESDRMIYIANRSGGQIKAIALPDRYFTATAGIQ